MPLKTNTTLGNVLTFAMLWSLLLLSTIAHAQLKADFNPTKTSDCESLITQFVDNSTGGPVSWQWDLGNGFISTEQSPSATYTSPGTYNVTLTVKNAAGNTSSVTKTVTVWAKPQPDFTANPASGCMPLAVTFNDKSNPVDGTITAYSWDFGDGVLGSGSNPVHTYNNVLSPTVTLTITNSNGCTASKRISKIVNVAGALNAKFDVSDKLLCATSSAVTINNTTTGPGNLSYQWDFGDGSTASGANPAPHSYSAKGVYKIKLTVTSDKGCIDTTTSEDINVATFKSDFQLPPNICENSSASFTALNTPQADKVTWSVDKGTITANGATATYQPAGTGTVKVTMTADYGPCQETITKDIVVTAAPTVDFATDIKPICDAPVTVNLTNKSQGANSWSWDFGNGQSSTQQNPTVVYNNLGTYNIRLTATSTAGCSSKVEQEVNLSRPRVDINANIPEGCVGITTRFTSYITPGDSIVSSEWDFGDGSPKSTEVTPSHTYTSDGTYTVTLNYTTKNGCKGSVSLASANAIRVYKQPKPDFSSPEAPQICGNNTVHFDAITDVGNKWTWDFGDNTGDVSSSKSTTHSYKKPGTYTVTLSVSNYTCASEKVTKVAYITAVNPFPRFSLQRIDCNNRTEMRFNDNSIGNITSWKWSWGDGKQDAYTTKISTLKHKYDKTGTYQVMLTVSDGSCTSSDSMTINVYAPSPITITADKTTLCGSDTLNTSVTAINKDIYGLNVWSYLWKSSDSTPVQGNGSDYQQTFFTNLLPGTDTIRFIAYNLQGCPDTSNKIIVNVHGPVAKFLIPAPECRGTELTFTDRTNTSKGKPITTWTWNFGDSSAVKVFTAPPFKHTYNQSGYFYPKLTVTDQDGCSSTASGPRVQVNGPNADFKPSASLIPPGGDVQFYNYTTETGGIPNYYWAFGDNTTSTEKSPTKNYPKKGVYTVTLLVRDNNGCIDTAQQQIKVSTVGASFKVTTSFVNNSGCPPVVAKFTNTSTNYTSSYWSFGDGSFSTVDNPSHTYTYAGRYKVRLKAIGEAGNQDIIEQEIEVKGPYGTIVTSSNGGCLTKDIEFKVSAIWAVNFSWDFTDGIVSETKDSIIKHSFKNPGIYQPRLILSDSAGCKGAAFLTDPIVIDKLEVEMTSSPQFVCGEGWVSFTPKFNSFSIDQLKKAAKYKWTYEPGIRAENDTSATPRFYLDKPKDYNFTLTTTTAYGCVESVSKTVTVYPKPAVSITGPSQACQEAPVSFKGNITTAPDIIWNWTFGNGSSANIQQPADQTYSNTGPSDVILIATSSNGCTDTAYHSINIVPKPVANATTASNVICLGSSTTLSASGGVTYQWSPATNLSNPTASSPLATPDVNTTYQVAVTDANGCSDTGEVSIQVAQPFTIQATPDTAACPGLVPLRVSGADKYVWKGQGLDDVNSPTPNATIATAGTYTYEVTAYDDEGCFSRDTSLTVTVHPAPSIDAGPDRTVTAGRPLTLRTTGSPDIVKWTWSPAEYLSCTTCQTPEALPNLSTIYKVEVENNYGCKATDEFSLKLLCSQDAVFLPTAFSPNRDGKNEWFYPKGRGVKEVVSMRVYDRWGSLVFERRHFQINTQTAGWDGTWKNQVAPIGTYVYSIETICEEGGTFMFNGTVTIVR
ncbi:PKD domain-containing protein [Chitinophaga filiformis]|uniref:Gliding motility-associated C-terminal domain-containing protein n=1 Tax=Chitinophaga filiformis TaxID=104663 RepID=A0A1G7SFB0_CHIFI|nr:PKD domain-containing protein [Chitinophaga filiformis]SDG20880.1 gliding motility-associated C-terminal domain-containing protein [Chitinophaga filiformis]